MNEEPWSVQVARAKGCTKIRERNGAWWCHCDFDTDHSPSKADGMLFDGIEMWLQPAASFQLLSEMVEAFAFYGLRKQARREEEGNKVLIPFQWFYVCEVQIGDDQREGPIYSDCYGATLEEAIARAWLEWKATTLGENR